MAKFCNQCGRPLKEGEVCDCQKNKTEKLDKKDFARAEENRTYDYSNSASNTSSSHSDDKNIMDDISYWQGKFQDKLGASFKEKVDDFKKMNEEINSYNDDVVIPSLINASEGEICVKQYDIATFKNMLMGFITYSKANCKLLVTNKRVLLSARGRDIKGNLNFQNEFSLSDIAGISLVSEYIPNPFKFILGLIISIFINTILVTMGGGNYDSGGFIMGILCIIIGLISSIMIKNNTILSLLASNVILAGATLSGGVGALTSMMTFESRQTALLKLIIFGIIAFFALIYTFLRIWAFAQVPNLTLSINTRSSFPAIDMRKREKKMFGLISDASGTNTGFDYVVPARDTELAIRELGSLISDIQSHGDYGIEKWKNI
ncbi:hypothetical protein [Anaerococcus tetradius]|uniref:Uncharacterized protein n=1 Tax=Anaerococcus tetradius TaxID=33036 RepID=A0A133KI41_9FIRM|nr:hypothetical protein [Anaerococcus tetradius]KWZ79207.1 hypothetical protein HMPREF3200_00265 [Anaerococcus tetradius]